MATERSSWNDCLALAAQLKQQSLTTQSPVRTGECHNKADSLARKAEKLRRYQLGMQNPENS